jgi:hypothetical protein
MPSYVPYRAPSHAAISMVVDFEAYGLEARFWPINKLRQFGNHKRVCRYLSGETFHKRTSGPE